MADVVIYRLCEEKQPKIEFTDMEIISLLRVRTNPKMVSSSPLNKDFLKMRNKSEILNELQLNKRFKIETVRSEWTNTFMSLKISERINFHKLKLNVYYHI